MEFFFHITDGGGVEMMQGRSFGDQVFVFELFLKEWTLVLDLIVERLIEDIHSIVQSFEALIFADVGP